MAVIFFNRFLSNLYSLYFEEYVPDVLSGIRGFNRSVVDFISLDSKEFEIESELSFKTYIYGFRVSYIPVMYMPERNVSDSFPKIKPFKDGFTILKKIFVMMMGW